MSYQTGIIECTFPNFDGESAEGNYEIIPSARIVRDQAGNQILSGRIKGSLSGGLLHVEVPASDDTSLDPTDVTYTVSVRLRSTNLPAIQGVFVPHGQTVQLAEWVSVDPTAPSYQTWVNQAATAAGQAATSAGAAAGSATAASGSATSASASAGNAASSATAAAGSATAAAASATNAASTVAAALPKVAATVSASGAAVVNKHNPVDAAAAARTISLPAGQPEGTQVSVEKVDTSANGVTITGSIRGNAGATLSLVWQFESVVLRADSTGSWWPVAGHKTKTSLDAAYAPASEATRATTAEAALRNLTDTTLATNLSGLYMAKGDGLVPRRRRPSRPQETVISRFEAGHTWSATAGAAGGTVNLNDTSDGFLSNQCITVTLQPNQTRDLDLMVATPFNPVGKSFVLDLKVDNPAALYYHTLYFALDSSLTNSSAFQIIAPGGWHAAPTNEWGTVTGHSGLLFTATGTGLGGGNAVKVRLRLQSQPAAATSVTIKVGGLSYYTPKPTRGVVSFTFDDSYASTYTTAIPILSKYRYRATAYPITGTVDTAGKYTLAQLQQMERIHGWEVGAHSTSAATHQNNWGLTGTGLDGELGALRSWLLAGGFQGETAAYPNGVSDGPTRFALSRYFSGARMTTSILGDETLPPANPAGIRSATLSSSTTLAQAKTCVDQAAAGPGWCVFTIHDLVTTATTSTQWGISDFTALVDYVATKAVDVLPVTEGLAVGSVVS